MQSYVCYIHTEASMTPHLRFIFAPNEEGILREMTAIMKEWPSFELLDLYDPTDRLVLRVAADDAPPFS